MILTNGHLVYRCTSCKYIFTFYDLGINLQIFLYIRIFVDPIRNANYRGKQKIQRVKIRLTLSSYVIKPCKWIKKLRNKYVWKLRQDYVTKITFELCQKVTLG